MSAQEVSELTVTFGGLNIRISREAPEAGQTGDTESIGSFFVVEAPGTGALAAPSGALSSPAGELAALGATSISTAGCAARLVVGRLQPESAGHCGVGFWHEPNSAFSAVLQ